MWKIRILVYSWWRNRYDKFSKFWHGLFQRYIWAFLLKWWRKMNHFSGNLSLPKVNISHFLKCLYKLFAKVKNTETLGIQFLHSITLMYLCMNMWFLEKDLKSFLKNLQYPIYWFENDLFGKQYFFTGTSNFCLGMDAFFMLILGWICL